MPLFLMIVKSALLFTNPTKVKLRSFANGIKAEKHFDIERAT